MFHVKIFRICFEFFFHYLNVGLIGVKNEHLIVNILMCIFMMQFTNFVYIFFGLTISDSDRSSSYFVPIKYNSHSADLLTKN